MHKIMFRVDANATMGTGHLMRCLALAQALKKQHISSTFVVSDEAAAICKSRQDWVGEIITLPGNIDTIEELEYIKSVYIQDACDALVLDGYQFDSDYRQALSADIACLILFDDSNYSGKLFADLVINGADNAAELGYPLSASHASLCTGPDYKVLRQEFVEATPLVWSKRQSIGIMMGGSDPLNITLPLLQSLQCLAQQMAIPHIKLLTGAAYKPLAELELFIKNSSLYIEHQHNSQQVADVFGQCALVISAAGSSQFELLACETPAILLVVADNQLNATQQASIQGWCEMLDARASVDFAQLAGQIVETYQNKATLLKMHQQCAKYRDVLGAKRVVEAIRQRLQSGRVYD
jgi:UDP-2,4-diacetamido-2,4,6-trideoxy-beta-L-altropyranose hydrolase